MRAAMRRENLRAPLLYRQSRSPARAALDFSALLLYFFHIAAGVFGTRYARFRLYAGAAHAVQRETLENPRAIKESVNTDTRRPRRVYRRARPSATERCQPEFARGERTFNDSQRRRKRDDIKLPRANDIQTRARAPHLTLFHLV